MRPLNVRRLLATHVDPGLSGELAELRDRVVEQFLTIQHQRTLLRDLQAAQTVERAIADARIADAENDARQARADVARLLEDAARCGEHQT